MMCTITAYSVVQSKSVKVIKGSSSFTSGTVFDSMGATWYYVAIVRLLIERDSYYIHRLSILCSIRFRVLCALVTNISFDAWPVVPDPSPPCL